MVTRRHTKSQTSEAEADEGHLAALNQCLRARALLFRLLSKVKIQNPIVVFQLTAPNV